MSKIEDGGSAFPVTVPLEFQFVNGGMSLRDWFAGMALQGLLANGADNDTSIIAPVRAYSIADDMIKARKKGSTHDPR